jgi:hypothetical protein
MTTFIGKNPAPAFNLPPERQAGCPFQPGSGHQTSKEHNLALILQILSPFSKNLSLDGTSPQFRLTFLVITIGYGLRGLGCLSDNLDGNGPTSLNVKNSGGI